MNTIDIPGLAMTRSMGDKVGAQAGVICEAGSKPNYNYYEIFFLIKTYKNHTKNLILIFILASFCLSSFCCLIDDFVIFDRVY